jgi:hypothetical protein
VTAIDLGRPSSHTTFEAPHNILRVERAGANIVLTGYRDSAGLNVSLVRLGEQPRIVSTRLLSHRFESEGRSHAFNALVGADDSGVMGLPTVMRRWESGRWWFRSEASDVSFLTVNAAGQVQSVGELPAHEDAQHGDYRCEVSCVDWYGNTRALFIGNRVFGLSGTELIEGAVANGRMRETRRLNLSAPPPRA